MHKFYPFDNTRVKLVDGDLCVLDCDGRHLCGYVAFPAAETPADWSGNYDADALQYLAIHGGLTFAEREGDWCVFGFDCAHSGDKDNERLRKPEYVMGLARQMRDQMVAYRERLTEWRAAPRERRIEIIDEITKLASIKTQYGFGAMIDMLSGGQKFGPTEGNAA
jgi:hypothetical protein